jgi:hypothetical protein
LSAVDKASASGSSLPGGGGCLHDEGEGKD